MTSAARLTAFAVAVVAVFGVGAALGEWVGPIRVDNTPVHAPTHTSQSGQDATPAVSEATP